jgi:GT2 family glycosyltransferase
VTGQTSVRAVLRIVVVLHRARFSTLRPLLAELRGVAAEADVLLSIVINRDDLTRREGRLRRASVDGVSLELMYQHNRYGVAGAYNSVLRRAGPDEVLVLLDADSRLDARYFAELSSIRSRLLSSFSFATVESFSDEMRISPYRLKRTVPCPITGPVDREIPLRFAEGVGVINSGLAGSVTSFRTVDGFSDRIPLDLSDVAWSIEAGRKGATLILLPMSRSHDLSIRSRGFGVRRLVGYLTACWRLAERTGDAAGSLRLMLRGLRALRWNLLRS